MPVVIHNREVQQTMELPQVQHTDEIVDVAVVMRHQVPTTQTAQTQRQVPVIQEAQRNAEAPAIVDIPVPQIILGQVADDTGSPTDSASPSGGARGRPDLTRTSPAAHRGDQPQLTLNDLEYETNEVSVRSAALSRAEADSDSAKRERAL